MSGYPNGSSQPEPADGPQAGQKVDGRYGGLVAVFVGAGRLST